MRRSTKSVGIDIGGTRTAVAVVDQDGSIMAGATWATEPGKGFHRAVERLEKTVENLLAQTREDARDLVGIGIGCAGPVDSARGLIANPYTLAGWEGCDIVSPLRKRFGVPVFLENDADAAVMGECWRGAGRDFNPVAILTFGTGVGGAVMIDGRILRGKNGEHPEIGHIPVAPAGTSCYCGIPGCLESIASGKAIGVAGAKAGFAGARAVFAAAARGESQAQQIIAQAEQAVATAAWTIFHTFLPQRLVLGGGVMDEHYERFVPAILQRLAPATQFSLNTLGLARAALGNDAGLVGAARLGRQSSSISPEQS